MLIAILLPLLLLSGLIAVLFLKRKTRKVKIPVYLVSAALLSIGLGLYLMVRQIDILTTYGRMNISVSSYVYLKLSFGAFLFLIGSVIDMLWFLSGKR